MDSLSSLQRTTSTDQFPLTSLPKDILGKIFKDNFKNRELAEKRSVSKSIRLAIDSAIEQEWTSVRNTLMARKEDPEDGVLLNQSACLISSIYSRKANEDLESAKLIADKEFPVEQKENSLNSFWRSVALTQIVIKEIHQNITSAKETAKGIDNLLFHSKAYLKIGKKEFENQGIDAANEAFNHISFSSMKKRGLCFVLTKTLEKKDFEEAQKIALLFKGIYLPKKNVYFAYALAEIATVQAKTDLVSAKNTAAMIEPLSFSLFSLKERVSYAKALSEIIKVEAQTDVNAASDTFSLFPHRIVNHKHLLLKDTTQLYLIQGYLSTGQSDKANQIAKDIEDESVAKEAKLLLETYYQQ